MTILWWRAADGARIKIDRQTVLPGFGEPDAHGVRDDITVTPASFANLTDDAREALGLAVVVETEPPVGVAVLDWSVDEDGGQVWETEPFTEQEIADQRAWLIAQIKTEASARILSVMSEAQQRNTLALAMELVTTHGSDPEAWPAEDRALHVAAMAAWARIKAIRAASDSLEAAAPHDAAGIAAFGISENPGWPA